MMKMEAQIRLINVESIIPNRFQPRLHFNDEGLNDLASSIKEHGVIQPLVVRRVGDKFEIIAGERRFKASTMAGLNEVPCIISDLDDNESAEVAILENTQRRNLSAIEEARAYKKLLDRHYITQDQLAKRLGTSQSTVANKLRLLNLDENVQKALINEQISERHARSLLRLTDKMKQVEILNKIISERWPVKKVDEVIDEITKNYQNKGDITGNINISNKMDIDVDDIMNNSVDIMFDENTSAPSQYTFQSNREKRKAGKNSLFFNNLENESVNMDPTLNFGFNPFSSSVNTSDVEPDEEDDYDLLDLEEKEEVVEEVKEEEKVVTLKLEKNDDVIKEIKNVLSKAKINGLGVNVEEFDFNQMYQFVIRIDKEDK